MFGKILHETGALIRSPSKCLNPSVTAARIMPSALRGLARALPLFFFKAAIVLLISVAFSMARHTGTNLVKLVIPLFAGVAAAAGSASGPAPMLLASQMNADSGWMIRDWPVCGNSGMIIAGPLWGRFISRYVESQILTTSVVLISGEGNMLIFVFSLSLILLPLVLVGLKTIAACFVPEGLPLTNGSSLLVIRLPRFWLLVW
ncbi:hypothetical protein ACLBOM_04670 [Escherichia coli]